MLNAAIIGATGYTGAESINIILRHPQAQLTYLTALPEECGPVPEIFPRFTGRCSMNIEPLDLNKLASLADVALCCLPHKISMGFVPRLLEAGLKVVDFSADYRIKNPHLYTQFYKVTHTDTANLEHAVYGLPELFREKIKPARLVANPGCYPTGLLLAIAPLLKEKLIHTDSIINNAVTGVSGAGKNPSEKFHFPNMNENIFPYAVAAHRHMPEMEQIASQIADAPAKILFQPHAAPIDQGILSSVYCKPAKNIDPAQLLQLFRDFYKNEPFVHVCDGPPNLKPVRGTNYCHLYSTVAKDTIIAFSAIDNLIKGAAGQAVQNMNLIFGLEETLGLR